MRKQLKKISAILMVLLSITVLSGCTGESSDSFAATVTEGAQAVVVASEPAAETIDLSDLAVEVDEEQIAFMEGLEWDQTAWDGNGSQVVLEGESVLIDQAGTYILEGNYSGQIVIDTEEEEMVRLVFNGASLSNSQEAPLYIKNAELVVLTLVDGTSNTITDISPHVENAEIQDVTNGAITSKVDLVIEGTGSLLIQAENKSGILAKDSLLVEDGSLEILAAKNGIKANDLFWMTGGRLSIEAGTDGLESETDMLVDGGTLWIESMEDSLHAEGSIVINGGEFILKSNDDAIRSDESLVINDGTIRVTESYEGLESFLMIINGGQISIVASDDGINVVDTSEKTETAAAGIDDKRAGGMVVEGAGLIINGGNIYISTSGDGIDSNGSGLMTGGVVLVDGPGNGGDVGVDFNDPLVVEGGTLIAVGNDGAGSTPSESSTQNVLSVYFDSNMPAGSEVTVLAEDGQVLMEHASIKDFAVLVFSSSELETGETVRVQIDGVTVEEVQISDTMTVVGTSKIGEGGPGMRGNRMAPDGQMPEGMERPERPDGQMPPDQNAGASATE